MATYQAVAAVTAVLDHLINEELSRLNADGALDVGVVKVKAEPPKDTRNDSQAEEAAVHIYLYRITENAIWRNNDLPLRSGSGGLMQRPRLALNLHYLITFYGKDTEYVPQKLLGAVTSLFQRQPIFTSQLFEDIDQTNDANLKALVQASQLAAEIEKVKLTMTTLDVEELSKLWSVLLQVPYSLSLTYEASVIFIEPGREPARPLPVYDRQFGTTPGIDTAVPPITKLSDADDDIQIVAGILSLAVSPPLNPNQSALLILTEDFRSTEQPVKQHVLAWEPPKSDDSPISRPEWSVADIEPGAYFVRLLVEGQVSEMHFSSEGVLQGPQVIIGATP